MPANGVCPDGFRRGFGPRGPVCFKPIKKKLKNVKGVKDVKTEYHNKVAECSIQADMGAEPLAEKLLDVLPELEIQDVTQNVIKAKYNADE